MFEAAKQKIAQQKTELTEFNAALLNLLADLRYPVSKDGSVLDMTFYAPLLAWHLVRCGWRPDPEHRKIKPRKVIAKGVIADAVEWVSIDEPDDPLEDIANMTMAQINALSPAMKAEALRRMGGPETPELQPNQGWRVRPSLKVQDAPDVADGYHWTQRGVS